VMRSKVQKSPGWLVNITVYHASGTCVVSHDGSDFVCNACN
jgi:hypothetical protein